MAGIGQFFKPIAIVHIKDSRVEDITPLELRGIIDVFESAGARKVFIWRGCEINEQDVISFDFLKKGKEGGSFLYKPGMKGIHLNS